LRDFSLKNSTNSDTTNATILSQQQKVEELVPSLKNMCGGVTLPSDYKIACT